MTPVISDPRLQELWVLDVADCTVASEQAFILALNARLEAAHKLAHATYDFFDMMEDGPDESDIAMVVGNLRAAHEAYRSTQQESSSHG
jgi:hypothetical protein